ncbi:MAG: hypothetical protein ACKVP5_09710 [Aestuariivirga sp.]
MSNCEWDVVAAAFIGAAAGTVGVWLNHWLTNRRTDKLDSARKELLKKMLANDDWKWRTVSTLSHVIGADEETTKRLLLEIGARASEDGQPKWGLISRVGLPGKE